jgi:hypothetical protein
VSVNSKDIGGTGMSASEPRQIFEILDLGLPVARDISIDALIDDWEGFRVLLRNHLTNGVTRIAFDTHLAYLSRDESDFIGEALRSEGYGRDGFHGSFYRVRNSEFVARYLRDSLRGYSASDLAHFSIVTGDQCIDVIALSDPRVEDLSEAAKRLADKATELQKSNPANKG